jgi:hypothetical protein
MKVLTGYSICTEEVKMKKIVFVMVFLAFFFSMITAPNGSEVKPAQSFNNSPSYEVENLEAVLHSAGFFMVSGEIRNTDIHPTKGYVIIYFANDNDEVIEVAEAVVNEKKAIDPGSTGTFELSKNIEEYKQIKKTFIEYVVKEKILTPKKPLISIGAKR